jgi:cyclophilin family peptidyl-prolyl cis-trans isomerase/Flp pilus assembly protein TadD
MRLLAPPLLLLLLALPVARAQDDLGPPAPEPEASAEVREALLARARALAVDDEAYNRLRYELVKLQERLALIEDQALTFREGKTVEDASKPEVRREAERLMSEMQAARAAFEEQLTGAPRARFVALRDKLSKAFGELVRDLDTTLASAPGDVTLRLVRGRLMADKGRFVEARGDAEKAIRARPEDPDALALLGMTLVVDNRFDDAAALFERAVERGPTDERKAYQAIGRYCTNRFAEARAARDSIQAPDALPVTLRMRCAWWLTDGELDRSSALWEREAAARAAEAAKGDLPRVELVTSRGRVELELFEDHAPNAVAGVVELVEAGFYDGLPFHRVVPNLAASAGVAPVGSRMAFADDPAAISSGTARGHFRGTVSLFRTAAANSATGELQLVVMPAASLDGRHEPIGRIVAGQAVVDALREGDRIERARVVRRRDHPYTAKKVPAPPPPAHEGEPGRDGRAPR